MSITQQSLIARLSQRDTEAWSRLQATYDPLVRSYLREHARSQGYYNFDNYVDDVVQNVWTKLLIASDRNPYDRSRARFRTYLYTITVNALRDWFRGERTHAEGRREMPDADGPWTPSESDEDEWNDAYKRAILKSVLDEVRGELLMSNPEKWESFARCALGGESAREVAADLGISVDAVYQHVSRVRKDVTDRVLAQYEEDLAE